MLQTNLVDTLTKVQACLITLRNNFKLTKKLETTDPNTKLWDYTSVFL